MDASTQAAHNSPTDARDHKKHRHQQPHLRKRQTKIAHKKWEQWRQQHVPKVRAGMRHAD
jgi:hypothetical protein